jgi:ribonucleoside-diphosphate reductase alpha chain
VKPTNGHAANGTATNGSATNGSATNGNGNGHAGGRDAVGSPANVAMLKRAGVAPKFDPATEGAGRDGQFAMFQLDAPSCDNCGAITVRNGNCYLCHNCGNSMGCS